MSYEILIRKAFNCGRDYSNGADADIYRKYERNERLYTTEKALKDAKKPRAWNASLEDLEYDTTSSQAAVIGNSRKAILKVMNNQGINHQQKNDLEECLNGLDEHRLPKTKLDEIIKKAVDVMTEMGLYPA